MIRFPPNYQSQPDDSTSNRHLHFKRFLFGVEKTSKNRRQNFDCARWEFPTSFMMNVSLYPTGLLSAMKRLIFNPVLMFLALGASADLAIIGIFAAFAVKYLQTQFGLSPGTSGMLIGK